MSMHLSFVRRTETGPATFKVKDVKLGARISVIHVSLTQGDSDREEVVAYITQTHLAKETGLSLPTSWNISPPPPSVSLPALLEGKDKGFVEPPEMPFSEFRKAVQNVRLFFPREGQPHQSIVDQWMRFKRPGDRFTNQSLGFVVDMFPQMIESYRNEGGSPYTISKQAATPTTKKGAAAGIDDLRKMEKGPFWYPTVLLNLDVKKVLPDEGVEWLFLRTRAKEIKNGRFDLEVVVMDEGGDVVALSHHVCLVVSAARNLAKRKTGKEEGGSKL